MNPHPHPRRRIPTDPAVEKTAQRFRELQHIPPPQMSDDDLELFVGSYVKNGRYSIAALSGFSGVGSELINKLLIKRPQLRIAWHINGKKRCSRRSSVAKI